MKIKGTSNRTRLAILTSVLLLLSSSVFAQNSLNFAGTWILDHSKSDAEFRDYKITCTIEQSTAAITVKQDLEMKDGQISSMPPITYTLDGKELLKEEQGGSNKITAVLSADKKSLTTKFVRTMNGNNFGSITKYILSDDGKTLTVKSSDLKNESPMIQTYNRK